MRGQPPLKHKLSQQKALLLSRRRFLIGLAGGSVAALFGMPGQARAELTTEQRWEIIDAVQQQLFPTEEKSPGAKEINALKYLKFVVTDTKVDQQERVFILQGAEWLEDLSQQNTNKSFLALDQTAKHKLIKQIAASQAGENWLSTLVLYLMEALLTAPAYGGNPNGIGWKWLGHTPGFPLPDQSNIYPALMVKHEL